MAMALVVMAAGRGSRFGGLKQVAEIGPSGEALLDYAVYDALRSGFERVVFVVSEESAGPVEDHVTNGAGRHVDVRYALQKTDGRKKPWGTGHAVLTASAEVDGRFAVINADDFYGPRSFEVLGQELAAEERDDLLIGFRLRDSLSPNGGVSRGVCQVDEGFLTTITELHDVQEVDGDVRCREGVDLTGDELFSANLWGFQPSFARVLAQEFEAFRAEHEDDQDAEFLIGDGIGALGRYGDERVRVVPTPERFLGITYAEDVAGVRDQIAALVDGGRYPSPLWS
ncbi:MAG TPA: NTP transferase domain-containing protein [Acidimicrobiales bacterium]|nr:NTP transferase domain-containing protein [Acidimicrobiales bacterium]